MSEAIPASAVARADEMLATLLSVMPVSPAEPLSIVEIGSDGGRLATAILESFPQAKLTVLESGEEKRADTIARLARFGDRVRVVSFDLAGLDWWELLWRVDVVVSFMTLHDLNEAKTQYLYKAIADRTSDRGSLIVADSLQTKPLFHQMVWLRHAGFGAVDCWWALSGHAVFGGAKKSDRSSGISYQEALKKVQRALRA